jgi:hypothetical protein
MADWIKVADLKPTAQTLALGAEHLEDAAKGAPAAPDAGTSSEKVSKAMIAGFRSVATLATQMATAADIVQAQDAAYRTKDQDNADRIPQPPKPGGK